MSILDFHSPSSAPFERGRGSSWLGNEFRRSTAGENPQLWQKLPSGAGWWNLLEINGETENFIFKYE
jgi:hypothetical protein